MVAKEAAAPIGKAIVNAMCVFRPLCPRPQLGNVGHPLRPVAGDRTNGAQMTAVVADMCTDAHRNPYGTTELLVRAI